MHVLNNLVVSNKVHYLGLSDTPALGSSAAPMPTSANIISAASSSTAASTPLQRANLEHDVMLMRRAEEMGNRTMERAGWGVFQDRRDRKSVV